MTRRSIKLIVLLTSVSLLALIGTQLYWIKNAINLSEKHFDHRVTLALKDVVDEIEKINKKSSLKISEIPICKKSR